MAFLTVGCWAESESQTIRVASAGRTIDTRTIENPLSHVTAIAIAADSSVLVLDPTLKALTRFSPRGEYLGRIGRDGAGPGEFRWPMTMGRLGDQVWVMDFQLRRITRFDRGHKVASTRTIESGGLVMPMTGGVHALQPQVLTMPGEDLSAQVQWLALVQPDKRELKVGRWTVNENPIRVDAPGFTGPQQQPFTDRPLWAVSPDGEHAVVVESESNAGTSLRIVTSEGRETFRKALPWRRVPVTDALFTRTVDSMIARFREIRLPSGTSMTVDAGAVRKAVGRPRDVSPVTQVLVGSDGRIWLRLRNSSRAGYAEWQSYSMTGAAGSGVLLPVEVYVFVFTATAAWGTKDADGDPLVVEYRLPD